MRGRAVLRWLTATSVGALVLGAVALPSVASPGAASELSSHLEMMRAAVAAPTVSVDRTTSTADSRSASQAAPEDADVTCLDDPADDERKDFDAPTATNEPRTDILEHCVGYGPTLSLSVRVAQPTDPLTDEGWQHATFAGWYVDTDDDGAGDYYVDYSLEAGEEEPTLGARVVELVNGEEGATVCSQDLVPNYTGWFSVSNIGPECLGDAGTISVQVAMFYQAQSGGDETFDTAPDAGAFTANVTSSGDRTTRRLGGKDRIETAIQISQEQFPAGSRDVYLARTDLFADAVSGGVLTNGPILLVPRCDDVPESVSAEIDRLDPEKVYALGGEQAICDASLADAADGRATDRIFGRDRIKTSVAISQFQFSAPAAVDEVYIARSDVFVDAVAGGVLTGGPVLLVPSCGFVPQEVEDEIDRLDPRIVYSLGGPAAVCEPTLDAASLGYDQGRLAGPTRIETAIAISQHEFPQAAPTVYVARARPDDKLADSVAGGSLTGGPVLLVPECGDLPVAVAGEISRVAPHEVIALGGIAAVCQDMLDQAGDA